MATVRDVITSAYRRLGLVAPGEDLDADRAFAGLEMFNDLLASLQAEGSTDPAPSPGGGILAIPETGVAEDLVLPYALNDAFPMAAKFEQGVKAMLAVQIAPENGNEAPGTIQREARKAVRAILAAYVQAPAAQFDPGLTRMPSLRGHGGGR